MVSSSFIKYVLLFTFVQYISARFRVRLVDLDEETDTTKKTGIVSKMLTMQEYKALNMNEVKMYGKTYVMEPTPATPRDVEYTKYLAMLTGYCAKDVAKDCYDLLVVTSYEDATLGKFVAAAKLLKLADDSDLKTGVSENAAGNLDFVTVDQQCVVVTGMDVSVAYTSSKCTDYVRPYTKGFVWKTIH